MTQTHPPFKLEELDGEACITLGSVVLIRLTPSGVYRQTISEDDMRLLQSEYWLPFKEHTFYGENKPNGYKFMDYNEEQDFRVSQHKRGE